jgi:hypothetical protein
MRLLRIQFLLTMESIDGLAAMKETGGDFLRSRFSI